MVLTGGYHSHSHVIDLQRRVNTTIPVQFLDKRGKQVGIPRYYRNKRLLGTVPIVTTQPPVVIETPERMDRSRPDGIRQDVTMSDVSRESRCSTMNGEFDPNSSANPSQNLCPTQDLTQRITMGTWHPKENIFAVAKHNSLFIYTEKRQTSS